MNADEDGFLPAARSDADGSYAQDEMEVEDDEIEVHMGQEEMDMDSVDQDPSESMIRSEIAKMVPMYQASVKASLETLHELGFPAARAFPALQRCRWSVADTARLLLDMDQLAQETSLPAGSRSPIPTLGVASSATEKSAKSPFDHRRDSPLSPSSSKNVGAAVADGRARAARATGEDEEDINLQEAIRNSLLSSRRSHSLPRDPHKLSSQGLHSPSSGGVAGATSSAAPPTSRSLRPRREEAGLSKFDTTTRYSLTSSEEED
jgi:hypothetical protein